MHVIGVTVFDDAGKSASARHAVTVSNAPPSVVIDSPADGAVVEGEVPIQFTPAPSPSTQSPIEHADLFVDDHKVGLDSVSPWSIRLDTTLLANGPHTIRVDVYDEYRASASTTQALTVNNHPNP